MSSLRTSLSLMSFLAILLILQPAPVRSQASLEKLSLPADSRPEIVSGASPRLESTRVVTVLLTYASVLSSSQSLASLPAVSLSKTQVVALAVQESPVRLTPLLRRPLSTVPAFSLQMAVALKFFQPESPLVIGPPTQLSRQIALAGQDFDAYQPEVSADVVPPALSANLFSLVPLAGQSDGRPAAEHGDLNLKLREPQPIAADLTLVDINGSGLDPDAPNLGSIFKPDFTRAYTVHDWDWGCNCEGRLLNQDHLVLVGIRTTPGEPVFIPPRRQDVYQGKYYAIVLYASEDSLTFAYTRAGNVASGYTVHYLGLKTDPNLVALFRQSHGNQLPGLTLTTPVGVATAELIVAIRDNGTFMDVRSRQDWWK